MADYVKQMRSPLEKDAFRAVAVDLRYNSGGAVLAPMIHMLWQMQEAQDFALYAHIGEGTYSSGVMNAAQLKWNVGAVLVGRPTGGALNCYGDIQGVVLPNTGMTVTYSTKYFDLLPGYGIESLAPDVAIPSAPYEDFIQGADPEIDYILANP